MEDGGLDLAHVDLRLKIVDECLAPLDPPVRKLANFLTIESFPRLPSQVRKQRHHKKWISHIDESVAHITIVLKVDGQVEEVVPTMVFLV